MPHDTLDRARDRRSAPTQVRTALDRALRTLAARGRASTLVDVVHGRILRQHADGLERYLMLRIGDRARARTAMRELRASVATADSEAFVAPPSVRAHLYRLARSIAARHVDETGAGTSQRHLSLRYVAATSSPDLTVHTAIRTQLVDPALELLELHYLRGLTLDEIACVVGKESPQVKVGGDTALRQLQAAIAGAGGEPSRWGELLEGALSLDLGIEETADDEDDEFAPLPPGTVLGGRYALAQRVGAGAFGEVYRANDTEVPGHVVALKLLYQPSTSTDSRASALRELHLIASVFHPSIVQFKDHGWHENRLWFVMPWYEGESLESRIRRAPLTRQEAHRIFKSLARALASMHAAGIRHQDVKPDNVFLARIQTSADDDVLPILLDLGVAAKDAEMIVAGTPTYFAPEVAAQFAHAPELPPIGPKADVFSLALTLRNALEPSTEPTIGDGVELFIAARALETPAPPSAKELAFLAPSFRRWLDIDPTKRPDANGFADELDVLLEPEARRARRKAVAAVVLPLMAIAVSVVVGLSLFFSRQVETEREEAAAANRTARHLRAALESSQDEQTRVDDALDDAQRRLEQGQLSRAQLQRAIDTASQTLQNALARLDAMRLRAETAERQSATAVQARTSAEQARDREAARGAQLAADLSARANELERERASNGELRSRLDATTAELSRVRAELESTRSEAASTEADLAAATARAEGLSRRIDEATGRAARMEAEVSALEAQVRSLRQANDRPRSSTPSGASNPGGESNRPGSAQQAAPPTAPTAPAPTGTTQTL